LISFIPYYFYIGCLFNNFLKSILLHNLIYLVEYTKKTHINQIFSSSVCAYVGIMSLGLGVCVSVCVWVCVCVFKCACKILKS